MNILTNSLPLYYHLHNVSSKLVVIVTEVEQQMYFIYQPFGDQIYLESYKFFFSQFLFFLSSYSHSPYAKGQTFQSNFKSNSEWPTLHTLNPLKTFVYTHTHTHQMYRTPLSRHTHVGVGGWVGAFSCPCTKPCSQFPFFTFTSN